MSKVNPQINILERKYNRCSCSSIIFHFFSSGIIAFLLLRRLILFTHSTVESFHIGKKLHYKLWVLQAKLWRRVAGPHEVLVALGGCVRGILGGLLESLWVDLLYQIELLFIEDYLLDTRLQLATRPTATLCRLASRQV